MLGVSIQNGSMCLSLKRKCKYSLHVSGQVLSGKKHARAPRRFSSPSDNSFPHAAQPGRGKPPPVAWRYGGFLRFPRFPY